MADFIEDEIGLNLGVQDELATRKAAWEKARANSILQKESVNPARRVQAKMIRARRNIAKAARNNKRISSPIEYNIGDSDKNIIRWLGAYGHKDSAYHEFAEFELNPGRPVSGTLEGYTVANAQIGLMVKKANLLATFAIDVATRRESLLETVIDIQINNPLIGKNRGLLPALQRLNREKVDPAFAAAEWKAVAYIGSGPRSIFNLQQLSRVANLDHYYPELVIQNPEYESVIWNTRANRSQAAKLAKKMGIPLKKAEDFNARDRQLSMLLRESEKQASLASRSYARIVDRRVKAKSNSKFVARRYRAQMRGEQLSDPIHWGGDPTNKQQLQRFSSVGTPTYKQQMQGIRSTLNGPSEEVKNNLQQIKRTKKFKGNKPEGIVLETQTQVIQQIEQQAIQTTEKIVTKAAVTKTATLTGIIATTLSVKAKKNWIGFTSLKTTLQHKQAQLAEKMAEKALFNKQWKEQLGTTPMGHKLQGRALRKAARMNHGTIAPTQMVNQAEQIEKKATGFLPALEQDHGFHLKTTTRLRTFVDKVAAKIQFLK